MAEIKHNVLSDYLSSLKSDNSSGTNLHDSNNLNKIPPVFFIWGEEFLCRKVFDAVISFLLPGNLKELCYELLEGEDAAIPAMMERICTYSFFQQIKVVAIKNAPIFSSSGTASSTGVLQSDLESLQSLIEKGFPENHYLVITSSNADKRRTLFTAIKNGLEEKVQNLKIKDAVYRDFRAGDIRHSNANIDQAKELLGYEPTHNLEQGLKESLSWYINDIKGNK